MKNKLEVKLARRTLKETPINDEYMYRDLARRMVNEMPIDELHKLIKLTKIDPFLIDDRIELYYNDDYSQELIDELIISDTIIYKAEVNLP